MTRVIRIVASVALALALGPTGDARADRRYRVEAYGIEVEVPAGWTKVVKPDSTMLAPRTFKRRGIQLAPLPAMPAATAEAIAKLIDDQDRVTIDKLRELERDGAKLIVATGKGDGGKGLVVSLDVLVVPTRGGAGALVVSYMRTDQDPSVRAANAEVLLSARAVGAKLDVSVTPPREPGVTGVPTAFVDQVRDVLAPGLDGLIRFPRTLAIRFEECGEINAYYSPRNHAIRMCHELFDDLVATFVAAGTERAKAIELARGTLLFVFFHEFGHALVGELDLPITGRGEDAADELATLTLAGSELGKRAAIDAARWFDLESRKRKKIRFWDDHSLDGQRVITITCLLYGADPKRYEPLMKRLGVDAGRLASCARDYAARDKAWMRLMTKHMRKPPLPETNP